MKSMNAFAWTEAPSVDAALAQLDGRAVVKAGGLDLLDLMKEGIVAPDRLVNIRNIKGLSQIEDDDRGGLRLGALVTLAELDAHPAVRERYGVLADAAGHAATPNIRNTASLGGNLLQRPRCWYFRSADFNCKKKGGVKCFAMEGENQFHAIFDNRTCAMVHPSSTATALLALNASVVLKSAKTERTLPLAEFFARPEQNLEQETVIGADEILTEVRIPALSNKTKQAFIKQGHRESYDWPLASVAAVLEIDGGVCKKASIVLGAAAAVPYRTEAAERALVGVPIDEQTARRAASEALTKATPLAHNAYKVPLFETVIRRALLKAAA